MLLLALNTRQPLLPFLGILAVGILVLSTGLAETARASDTEPSARHSDMPPDTKLSTTSPGFLFGDKLFPLPRNLSIRQQKTVFAVIAEAEPRLIVLHTQLRQTLESLHNLSFDSDTPADALPTLGRELIRLRTEILVELQKISVRLEQQAGFNPNWGSRRTGAIHQPSQCPLCLAEKLKEHQRESAEFYEQDEQPALGEPTGQPRSIELAGQPEQVTQPEPTKPTEQVGHSELSELVTQPAPVEQPKSIEQPAPAIQ